VSTLYRHHRQCARRIRYCCEIAGHEAGHGRGV